MMRLSQLIEGFAKLRGEDVEIGGLSLDSRTVQPGEAFLALPGTRDDGARFIPEAVARGCVAVLRDANGAGADAAGVPLVGIPHLAVNAGELASRFYGHPSRSMDVIGVTGTNGKTSFVHLLARALQRRSASGSIGTLGAGPVGREHALRHTTPDPISVHRELAAMRDAGVVSVAMEVSSHALDQHRVAGVRFAGAAWTNLTRDHLDYHGSMARYAAAKARLMAWEGLRFAILNHDDSWVDEFRKRTGKNVHCVEYGLKGGDYRAEELQFTGTGVVFTLRSPMGSTRVATRLLGRFNVHNLLAIAATLGALGWGLADIAAAIEAAEPVPGRVNALARPGQPVVVIDYAHTPDALEQCLTALREHGFRRISCVFGCGGDRDRGKRPLMAAAVEGLADRLIVTDDNPRTESGDRIIADILAGLQRPDEAIVERDRARAIAQAIRASGAGDLVLIAGKGHETYQEVGTERRPFDDRVAALEVLEGAA